MPKPWLYFIALVLPLALRVAVMNTGFVEWLWYHGQPDAYNALSTLRVQPQFVTFLGGWSLPVFTITMFSYWIALENHYEDMPGQFLMLPLLYLPFTLVGDAVATHEFHIANLYVHPLIIIPIGYLYIFLWAIFIQVLDKLKLVL